MYMLLGLGDASPGEVCETACVNNFTTSDAYYQCIANCEAIYPPGTTTTTTLPPGIVPTTTGTLPGSLTPPGYKPPTPATNWWRIGAAVALGLGVGVVLRLRSNLRGAGHAA